MNTLFSRRNVRANAAAALAIALLAGCATVSPAPFKEYHDAVLDLQASADRVLEADAKWSRESFHEGVKDRSTALADLTLEFDDTLAYGWTLPNEPLFVTVERTRSAFAHLNTTFVSYTDLLYQLAANKVASAEEFDTLANDLNANARKAAKALRIDASEDNVAIFSTAAAALARSYVENKKRRKLEETISSNQGGVDQFVQAATLAAQLAAEDLKAEYGLRFDRVNAVWRSAPADGRAAVIDDVLALNDEMVGLLKTLETLDVAYRTLAREHRELGRSLGKGADFSARELANTARRLKDQYEELKTK